MSDLRVGRNEPCACGSGKKFKHCCAPRHVNDAPPGYTLFQPPAGFFDEPSRFQFRPRSTYLSPYLKGKVFLSKNREWKDARLKDVEPGQEFIAEQRLFKVLSRQIVVECPDIDVTKFADADRYYDAGDRRSPNADDVVYVPGKDYPQTGHCLLSHVETHRRFRFQGRFYFLQPGRTPGSLELMDTGRVDRPTDDEACSRVWLQYTIQDPLGMAEVSYGYPCGQRILLHNGEVLPVEAMLPGMQFVLEEGDLATVTRVGLPEASPERPQDHDEYGVAPRSIMGRYKYTGWVLLMEVTWAGKVHRMTPAHLFWSESRRGWHPIDSFRVGELMLTH